MPDEVAAASERSSLRTFAERLIACDAGAREPGDSSVSGAFHVCEKLRPQLATLMGKRGFRALVQRALTLASADVPWLRALQVQEDGALDFAGAQEVQVDEEQLAEGRVVLLTRLLGLLVAFIGEILTLRLVRETWPNLPPPTVSTLTKELS